MLWFQCFQSFVLLCELTVARNKQDGCLNTLKESCKIVQDFKDFCFHSYFSLMDELIEKAHEDDEPMDIKYIA